MSAPQPANTPEEQDRRVHMAHCYQGENAGSCKYGEKDCPAKPANTSEELRIQVERIVAALADCGDNFMKPENVPKEVRDDYVNSILALLAAQKQRWDKEAEVRVLEWRIEQWRRGKKYMLNETWQPVFDELCAALDGVLGQPGGLAKPSEPAESKDTKSLTEASASASKEER